MGIGSIVLNSAKTLFVNSPYGYAVIAFETGDDYWECLYCDKQCYTITIIKTHVVLEHIVEVG